MTSLVGGLVFAFLATIPAYLFVDARRNRRAVAGTDTRSTAGITDGQVAVTGTVTAGPVGTLTHPVTGEDAVLVDWGVEEDESTDDEADFDLDRTGAQALPFHLADDDGSVLVDATGADRVLSAAHTGTFVDFPETPSPEAERFIERVQANEQRCHEAGVLDVHNTPIQLADVATADRDLTYRASALQPGETAYVLGQARSNGDGTYVVDGNGDRFVVSDMDESAVADALGSDSWLLLGAAVVFYGVAIAVFLLG